ncbi:MULTISPECIES: hypothetical protein [Cyanophyceae]|uniref:hypothetical protein n=1 Tax=Cyanophyceae TaxID=3028117 RepID=UPI00016DC491|nr:MULTISPECIES: hypothetical protein [Cyanophyceae]ACA98937.1 hypothetical protein SYNPCC7002_A0933 [Picosynechococcus sp. PCC 7002]SMH36753.1 hypothetical protein SAMN06272755_0790 [Picosynechococcus sp. OG1]SMQ77755.1 hypothetical protein SAMN06272774_0069 [Synechococcus sp. 7002]
MAKFNSSTITFATIIAFAAIGQAAQAGESYVRNTFEHSTSKTTSNLDLESKDWYHGSREWSNYAYKEYYDGTVTTSVDGELSSEIALTGTFEGTVEGTIQDGALCNQCGGPVDFFEDDFSGTTEGTISLEGTENTIASDFTTTSDYDGFTFHVAGAHETGNETFGGYSKVTGTIEAIMRSTTDSHETAAGNR